MSRDALAYLLKWHTCTKPFLWLYALCISDTETSFYDIHCPVSIDPETSFYDIHCPVSQWCIKLVFIKCIALCVSDAENSFYKIHCPVCQLTQKPVFIKFIALMQKPVLIIKLTPEVQAWSRSWSRSCRSASHHSGRGTQPIKHYWH